MSRKILHVRIQSVVVQSNGDLPSDTTEKNNAIVATLIYPRSGAPTVSSSKILDLKDGEPVPFDPNDFWQSALFKEEVHLQSRLLVQVTDRDERSRFEKIFTAIFATVLGAGLGAATAGISNVLLGAVAKLGIGTVTGSIKGGQDEIIKVIGEAKMEIDIDQMSQEPAEHRLRLVAPKTLKKKIRFFREGRLVEEDHVFVTEGEPNGEIVLQLFSEPL